MELFLGSRARFLLFSFESWQSGIPDPTRDYVCVCCWWRFGWSQRPLDQQRSFCPKLKGSGWSSPLYTGVRGQETQLWAFLLHAGMDAAFVCFFPEAAIFVSIVLLVELPSVWAHASTVCLSAGRRPVMTTTCWPKDDSRRRQPPLALFLLSLERTSWRVQP